MIFKIGDEVFVLPTVWGNNDILSFYINKSGKITEEVEDSVFTVEFKDSLFGMNKWSFYKDDLELVENN